LWAESGFRLQSIWGGADNSMTVVMFALLTIIITVLVIVLGVVIYQRDEARKRAFYLEELIKYPVPHGQGLARSEIGDAAKHRRTIKSSEWLEEFEDE